VGSDIWAVGDAYEAYIGRWSRRVAPAFLDWLGPDWLGPDRPGSDRPGQAGGSDGSASRTCLDVGCGTGALTSAILGRGGPTLMVGADPSTGFLASARERTPTRSAVTGFVTADARRLPFADARFDAVVSALTLNFVPDPVAAAAEIRRVTRPGATAATYLWDYAGGIQLILRFWAAAEEFDPSVSVLDEAARFPLCAPEPLRRLWTDTGFGGVRLEAIEIPTVFRDFDDYWTPFLGGQGPAPGYVAALPEERRILIRERLRETLPTEPDGTIHLTARAWAVRGTA
jgi:SAM-dependent methyltransferase